MRGAVGILAKCLVNGVAAWFLTFMFVDLPFLALLVHEIRDRPLNP